MTRRYVPVETVTGLLEALAGTADQYEQAKANMAACVVELTEQPGIDEEAVYLEDTGGGLYVRSVRRWVSEWESVDG